MLTGLTGLAVSGVIVVDNSRTGVSFTAVVVKLGVSVRGGERGNSLGGIEIELVVCVGFKVRMDVGVGLRV